MTLLTRVRALALTAALWAAAWLPAGVLVGLFEYFRRAHAPGTLLSYIAVAVRDWALFGAISGAVFAFLVAVAERARRLGELSVGRFVLWGVVGALAAPATILVVLLMRYDGGSVTVDWPILAFACAWGGASAAATLVAARRPTGANLTSG